MSAMTITEFLLARIAEDEALAQGALQVVSEEGVQNVQDYYPDENPPGHWGHRLGPINYDERFGRGTVGALFDPESPRTGVEVRPWKIVDGGAWDATGRIEGGGDLEIAEVPGHHPAEVVRHIVRHDPSRVLADCEAKRRIVDMYANRVARDDDHPILAGQREGLGLAVAVLTSVYADHPDFREEWRL